MRKRKKGSFTVEAAVIVPMILLLIATTITVLFYWHDRCLLTGVVCEMATVGAEHEKKTEAELRTYGEKLIQGKLLWFPNAKLEIVMTDKKITIQASALYRGMKVNTQAMASVTYPEKYIRIKEEINESILQK